jgi:DNA-binding transcriptional LysR family regulator
MDITSLQIFKAVADHGGVNKAAAKLHRVPSNVTTRVKQLEERLGAKLFIRRNRRLDLSPEGRVLLGYAERLLRLTEEAETVVRNGMPRGVLRMGALESTAGARLPPLLSRFHRLYPEVRIELVTATSGALVTRVLEHDVEAAFVAEPFNADGLELQHAFDETLFLITPKGADRVRTPKDIGNRTLIAFANGCSYRRRLESWLGASKVMPDRILEFASYHAIVACVAGGAGIAIVPKSVIELTRAAKEVTVSPLPRNIANSRTHLAWRAGHQSVTLDALRGVVLEFAPTRAKAA